MPQEFLLLYGNHRLTLNRFGYAGTLPRHQSRCKTGTTNVLAGQSLEFRGLAQGSATEDTERGVTWLPYGPTAKAAEVGQVSDKVRMLIGAQPKLSLESASARAKALKLSTSRRRMAKTNARPGTVRSSTLLRDDISAACIPILGLDSLRLARDGSLPPYQLHLHMNAAATCTLAMERAKRVVVSTRAGMRRESLDAVAEPASAQKNVVTVPPPPPCAPIQRNEPAS
ncbi:hypothetical protein R3P38DRAFT_2756366 [Favolaschia claudopus]|uniref:Uncharacterized protein n=1 Tax=Favolaschia claudopus TaxID=2862362 RepID=A0AAW0EFH5_9AGAR